MFQLCCRTCLEQRNHTEVVSVFSMHDGFVIRDKLRELFDLEISQTDMLTTICKSCLTKVSTAQSIRVWFSKQNLKYQQLICSVSDPQADTNASNANSMPVEESSPMVESTTHEQESICADAGAVEEDEQYLIVSAEDETIRCTEEAVVYECNAQDDISGDSVMQQTTEFEVQLIVNGSPNEQPYFEIIQLEEEPTIVSKEIEKNRRFSSIDSDNLLGVDGRTGESFDEAQSEEELDEEEAATSDGIVAQNRRKADARPDEHECYLCGMRFDLEGPLIDHGIETHGDRFELIQCEICSIQFASQQSYRGHRCDVEGKFQCRYCEKVLTTRNAWKSHQNTHSREKSFQCDLCDRKFSQYSSMRRHRQVHSDYKGYECEFCHTKFRQRGVLLAHRRRHTGEKPYACDVCGNTFREHSALARHKALHNRDHRGKGKT
ncbi:zinc finger and SCAN domain-containing protein 31-like isoform X2 [Anopheles aquasalis]|uniref:zinc finger and SCAN domain-containing protein 31-like isoform X2 n=1 Tax=Anopheles aquasalis TaxID=42839 RepID=UPI00215AC80A|nr:zinc finger and SCAN domain-containing protein 31-like isoform X2 [Anopheles aquasalis]